jgi:hypothetical protein
MKRFTLFFFVMVVVLCCISSCTTTKYVPVVEYHTDTLIQKMTQRDSIYLHDSTIVREKGDTVLIERWHTRYRDREVHDTVYQSRNDTVPQPYPVTEYVERKMSAIDKLLIATGILSIISILIFAAYKMRRFLPFW